MKKCRQELLLRQLLSSVQVTSVTGWLEIVSPSGVSSGSSPAPPGPGVQQTGKEQRGTRAVSLPQVDITPIVSMDELPEAKASEQPRFPIKKVVGLRRTKIYPRAGYAWRESVFGKSIVDIKGIGAEPITLASEPLDWNFLLLPLHAQPPLVVTIPPLTLPCSVPSSMLRLRRTKPYFRLAASALAKQSSPEGAGERQRNGLGWPMPIDNTNHFYQYQRGGLRSG
ncbi:hypothetical protein AAG906_019277 [Vitis piasezkii]